MHAHDSAYAIIPLLFQVTNLSPSVAISMNYVDSSNIDKALEVTRLEGLVDPDSFDVYNKLAAVKDTRFVFLFSPVLFSLCPQIQIYSPSPPVPLCIFSVWRVSVSSCDTRAAERLLISCARSPEFPKIHVSCVHLSVY
jgi:hypothetical protein